MELLPHCDETILQSMAKTCGDFDIFCVYLLKDHVKLSKKTRNIGRKDCFTLNGMLQVREDFEKPGRDQDRYYIINYFYYAAFKYRILEIDEKGTGAEEGIHYDLFQNASIPEKYLLLIACFLLDRSFLKYDVDISWTLGEVMEWAVSVKDGEKEVYDLPSEINAGYDGSSLRILFRYLEELGAARIKDAEELESKRGRTKWKWQVETGPILPLLCDLWQYAPRYPEPGEVEELADFIFGDYVKNISGDLFTGNILKLFEEPDKKEYSDQLIELEIKVRYGSCVRCVCMNMTDTLYDLHWMIQKVFEFDNDHLFAFYIGHGMMRETYTIEEAVTNGEELSVKDTELGMLELRKGQSFSYLFDFGDMWWFDIKVLGIKEGNVPFPQLTKAVNPAPEQYPVWE